MSDSGIASFSRDLNTSLKMLRSRFYSVPHAEPITSSHERQALVRWQPSNNLRHLRISVDPEALVLGHAR
jgi:hypothetical protein